MSYVDFEYIRGSIHHWIESGIQERNFIFNETSKNELKSIVIRKINKVVSEDQFPSSGLDFYTAYSNARIDSYWEQYRSTLEGHV